jgi:[ribosomal protein S5]-alanine N-acetyltransferase
MTTPDTTTPPEVRLVLIPFDALEALLSGDPDRAGAITGVPLPELFITDRAAQGIWRYRRDQILREPESAPWLVRAAIGEPAGIVVGHAGFHGPPDDAGMVEIGYTILPEYRRQGYGRAAVTALLREAAAAPSVRTVRASISPNNVASLALARSFGFAQVGEQWDEEDGLELVYERPVEVHR